MNRLRDFFFFVALIVAAVFAGRFMWDLVGPAIEAVPSLLAAVPGWVWWTAFGIAMSFACPMRAMWGGGCRKASSRCTSRTPNATASL